MARSNDMNNSSVCDVLAAISLLVIAASSMLIAASLLVGTFYPIFTAAQIAAQHGAG